MRRFWTAISLRLSTIIALLGSSATVVAAIEVPTITAGHGIVVAGHPEAAAIGIEILKAGGNAIDAAVATSLALGVAEPFGSGLGGKLVLLYFEAASGRTRIVEAMDAAGSLRVSDYLQRPDSEWSYGYGAVCVPGLPAGLWLAHQQWGIKPWTHDVQPAIQLAERGAEVLPKTRDLYAEQEERLRLGDGEIARLYLPDGSLPEVGSRVALPELAQTLRHFAARGRDGFYRGPVAEAIVHAMRTGGGVISESDLADYEARISEPMATDFRGYRLLSAPPPTCGAAMVFPLLKALEDDDFFGGPLRTRANLGKIGRVWNVVAAEMWEKVGDAPESRGLVEGLLTSRAIADLRRAAATGEERRPRLTSSREIPPFYESEQAATTHFVIVDAAGNIVCATQSLSVHFGAGVVPPGTGVVLNNSMSNFSYGDPANINYVAPGRRARSTIAPTLVLKEGRPLLALGLPGSSRIPTALAQVLLDRLTLQRPMAEAIGDTRFHFIAPTRNSPGFVFEAERSLPSPLRSAIVEHGWTVSLPEDPGRGRYFGGINAVEFNDDGTLTGFADPRRSNAAAGY